MRLGDFGILVARLRSQYLVTEIDGSILGGVDLLCPLSKYINTLSALLQTIQLTNEHSGEKCYA